MKSYLAAAVQMTSLPDLAKNLAQAEELIELAVRRGAELVSLPENFAFLGTEEDKVSQADSIATQTEKFLKAAAQKFQVTLVGGGFPANRILPFTWSSPARRRKGSRRDGPTH